MTRLLAIIGALVVLLTVVVLWDEGERGSKARASDPPGAAPGGAKEPLNPEAQPELLQHLQTEAKRETVTPAQAPERPRSKQSSGKKNGLAISGMVVDDLGTPVPEFVIEVESPGAELGDSRFLVKLEGFGETTQTKRRPLSQSGKNEKPVRRGKNEKAVQRFSSPDGAFHLDGLAAGQWQVTARTGVERRSAPALVSASEQADRTVLVVPRSGAVSGFVVGTEGAPVVDAKLYLHYPGEEDIDFRRGEEPEPRTQAGAAGAFFLEVLPGTVEIMARHPEFSDGEWMKLTVAPGALLQGVEIHLTQGGRIEGRLDPSLGDVTKREIGLFSFRGGIGWRDARTDAMGNFVIENVVPQDYVIELAARDGKVGFSDQPGIRKNISVKEGETTRVHFDAVRHPIAIHGIVTAGGMPSVGLSVSAYSADNEVRGEEAKTGPDGRFELTVAGPGDYWFRVSANYGSSVNVEQTVPDGSDHEVALEVPGGALSGRVVDSNGRALGHVPITIVRNGYTRETFYRDCYRRDYTSADGSFHFLLLAPGSYTLRSPDGFQDDSPPPRVPHGRVILTDLVVALVEVAGVEVRLPAEGRIAGVVVDARGSPVTGAWICPVDPRDIPLAGDRWETRSDATGHFEIDNVAPGTHAVRARSGENEAKSPTFEVEAGKTASTRVELE